MKARFFMSAYLLSAQPGRLRQRVIVIRLAESVVESILANSHLSTPHPIYYSDRLHHATPRPRLRIRAYTMMASPGASKPRGKWRILRHRKCWGGSSCQ